MMKLFKEPIIISVAETPLTGEGTALWKGVHKGLNILLKTPVETHRRIPGVYILWADSLNAELTRWLTRHKETRTRFLLLAEQTSSDTLAKHILGLGLRRWDSFYSVEFHGQKDSHELQALILRLWQGLSSTGVSERIWDAKFESGILKVVSTGFQKLEIPVQKIPAFKNATPENLRKFEVDEDGAFVSWPDLDVHLGWEQLLGIISPSLALKARQRSDFFNKRFGAALRVCREDAGLTQAQLGGLSERQVQRIERGHCRATSNAVAAYSKAHGLSPNEYLQKVSSLLQDESSPSLPRRQQRSKKSIPA